MKPPLASRQFHAPRTYGASVLVVLPLTWWQRIRILFGARVAARVGLTSARFIGQMQVGADVIVQWRKP